MSSTTNRMFQITAKPLFHLRGSAYESGALAPEDHIPGISDVGGPIDCKERDTESPEVGLDSSIIDSLYSSYSGILGIPNEGELTIVKRSQQKYAGDLDNLHNQSRDLRLKIHLLYDALEATHREIEATELRSAKCQALSAPIHSLPAEILIKIFQFTIPLSKKIMSSTAPLVLCRVSKLWREIVLHDPNLWNRFSFVIPSSLDLPGERSLLQDVQLFVRNSGSIPLEICVSDIRGQHTGRSLQRSSVLWYLTPIFSRCRHLSLGISDHSVARYIAKEMNAVFPTIETLDLKFDPHVPFDSTASFTILAPVLRSVNLKVHHVQIDKISLPWHQLTTLSCTMTARYVMNAYRSVSQWGKLVAKCPQLENLQVYFQGHGATGKEYLFEGGIHESTTLEPFRNLRNLVVRVGCSGTLEFLLTLFSFPILESLRVDAVSQPFRLFGSIMVAQVNDSIRQSMGYMSRLVRLSLIRVVIEDDCLLALLKFTPLLVFLDVLRGEFDLSSRGYLPDDEVLVESLSLSTNALTGDPLLPNLRDLRLYFTEWHGPESADPRRYSRLAMSRYQWAATNRQPDRGKQECDAVTSPTFPTYPFRLYVKFEIEDWEMKDVIAQDIGPNHCAMFHPELTRRYFLREGY
ncbi:hypothetical protein GALMADRAFT_273308 [Galerina marginata CBS 339.88]|uniref:F-box domain-containing protein n=1 Tax=Galerina marginata (strain CBS 339.88) TaxID=685588 RepID=A0A067S8I7_GALM3|nr:hypothetical protein GALMADRAFT_273308 [Galerina marginata CBS 339.88]